MAERVVFKIWVRAIDAYKIAYIELDPETRVVIRCTPKVKFMLGWPFLKVRSKCKQHQFGLQQVVRNIPSGDHWETLPQEQGPVQSIAHAFDKPRKSDILLFIN